MKITGGGFTIIELMITVAIAAVLVALAVPNFNGTIKNNRLITKANDIGAAFNIARQMAISRNSIVFVCHSNNADANNPSCDGGTSSGWNTGYIVYAAPFNGQTTSNRDYNSGTDTLIKKIDLGDSDGISSTATNAANYVAFSSSGLLFDSSNAPVIKLCDDRTGESGRIIQISAAGRFRIEKAEGADSCA